MINEKMIELVLLSIITKELPYDRENNVLLFKDKAYSIDKIEPRIHQLISEFLEPYVTEYHSKEE